MRLTDDQKNFLANHNISENEVFDATSMRPKDYKTKMKDGGYRVAIGVSKCGAVGHTMRNRHGSCVQCDPAALAFQARYKRTMYLYIAQPNTSAITKIGITDNLQDRERQLNMHKLAGLKTWEIKYSVECPNAGRVENKISKLLFAFNKPTPYHSKAGEICEEVYRCSYEQALAAINKILVAK